MERNNRTTIRHLTVSAMLLAVGMVLPLLTMQLKEIGDTLLPMHLPVLLCGILCGWKYGGTIGLLLPFLRSVTFGKPPLYPNAVWMALELMTYGAVIGLVYLLGPKKELLRIYVALISAMLAGRVVWGISKAILLGVAGKAFTMELFLVGGFLDAIPGIVLQLLLVPTLVILAKKVMKRGT